MQIAVIYGTERKGCSYHIAQEVLHHFSGAHITEHFLPHALPAYCTGCYRCFSGEVNDCPHSEYTIPLRQDLLRADLVVLTSPVYAYHISGQMKVFLDHFANMWIVHRPEPAMFHKQGLVIATASGPVYAKALQEMKDSLDFWGVAKTYTLGCAVFETRWEHVSPKIKRKICKKAARIAHSLQAGHGRARPNLRVRKWFYVSRLMQKHWGANPPDVAYWRAQGWLAKKRPWHR